MKFLLVGHGGCYNRGCEAILRSTIMILNNSFNSPEIVISSFDFKRDKNIDFGKNVKVVRSHLNKMWEIGSKDWFLRQFRKIKNRINISNIEFLPILKELIDSDLILSVGGDNYTMDYGFPHHFLKLNKIVKDLNKKLVIWGASIGPFPKDTRLDEIKSSLSLADLITVREPTTFDYLKSLGIETKIKLVADPAFLLPREPIELKFVKPNSLNNLLGLNISPILKWYLKSNNTFDVKKEIEGFIKRAIEKFGIRVLLIPHVTGQTSSNNDFIFMKPIYEKFKDTNQVFLVPPYYNASQTKYIISKCRYFIGARTHSTIAALSLAIPTISICYSIKAVGINKDIFNSTDYLLNINDLSSETLFEKFKDISENEISIKSRLEIKIAQIKDLAWKNVEYLKSII